MRLAALLQPIYTLPAKADRVISGLKLDSRMIQPHDVFLAIRGKHVDGREYIEAAIKQGATAVLLEGEGPLSWHAEVPLIPIPHLSNQMGLLAATFHQFPSQQLPLIGVTGTSGKTSCTHFIAQIAEMLQLPCGLIGTLGNGFINDLQETGLTTPDAIALQATLRQFVEKEAKLIAMEVSSHSIEQGRINATTFEVGLFTNLSQDHLDYHVTMAAYAAVKKRFFTDFSLKKRVLNAEDPHAQKWLTEWDDAYTYGFAKQGARSTYLETVQHHAHAHEATIVTPWGKGKLMVPLPGRFNLHNALGVITALCLLDIPLNTILEVFPQLKGVPGRMQRLGGGKGQPIVVVDYAHKPDALENVLRALKPHTRGKLICVFGCGGERDKEKRPQMAAIAERWADQVIITNDNPRQEDPDAIIRDILCGFHHPETVLVELDRSKAIRNSIQSASENDCILIAGKGAERYQQVGRHKIPFDDVEKVLENL